MTSDALGKIFAPYILGNLTENIKLHLPDKSGDGREEGPSVAGQIGRDKRGLRRFLRSKGAEKGKDEIENTKEQLRIAAWVVELLVRNWESIVAEYGKGMEGVDAMVEGLWDWDYD